MEVRGQIHDTAALRPGKGTRHPLKDVVNFIVQVTPLILRLTFIELPTGPSGRAV
jgi:hypothetical protein